VPDWWGELGEDCAEGTLIWTDVADVCAGRVPMWESDRHFLPLVFAQRPRLFHGVMPFANRKALSWNYAAR
jgi:8-oxo-dGTP diphosphatase